jgi:hypothetical protein
MNDAVVDVAVIDSGVNPWHSHVGEVDGGAAFAVESGGRVVESADFRDEIGHGTAIIGIIRERAPQARVRALKVFQRELNAPVAALIAALEWALRENIGVIHLSLGTEREEDRESLERLCREAWKANAVVVASARSPDDIVFPASFETVIGVYWNRECDEDSVIYHPGAPVEFGACGWPRALPGVPRDRNFHGHSFAAAYVTARAAKLLEKNPEGGTPWVQDVLRSTASGRGNNRQRDS